MLCLALSGLAGPAALAEPLFDFSGEASMGVTYDDSAADRFSLHSGSRFDTMVATRMDNGLTIGVKTRIQGGDGRPMRPNAPQFFITTGTPKPLPNRP